MLKIRLLRNLDIRTLLCIFRLMFIQRAMTSCNGRTNPKTLMTVYEYKDTTTVIPSPKLALGKIQQYVGQDKIEKKRIFSARWHPSGTAFILGAVTYFGDWEFRSKLLRTANLAGVTVRKKKKHTRHYRLDKIAIVGEAVALGMRTNVKWL